jgi:hypothetical protein
MRRVFFRLASPYAAAVANWTAGERPKRQHRYRSSVKYGMA